jgi:hypothetical protein
MKEIILAKLTIHVWTYGIEDVNMLNYIGFEVLTAIAMESSVFWHLTQCSPLKLNRTFRRNMSPLPSG